ncbi:MAG: hypothetical protein ABS76_05065 [Pelagibacterium sp. SCN 64-44]|nr:MAG: hypothetical protein ABS76_05065 [Pelagibacterium sp. SCN 64-44]
MSYRVIAHIEDGAQARALIVALRAYGFHPLEPGDGGFPGVPNFFTDAGIPVQVPEEEAADAGELAAALLKEMAGRGE